MHCHWIAAIDDGARSMDEGLAMLRGLHQAGFDSVVATPHMRPGMFDNDRARIELLNRPFGEMEETADVVILVVGREKTFSFGRRELERGKSDTLAELAGQGEVQVNQLTKSYGNGAANWFGAHKEPRRSVLRPERQ